MLKKNICKLPSGILNDYYIKQLIEQKNIKNGTKANISPASLDLVLTDEIYRLNSVFLPPQDWTVNQILKRGKIVNYSYRLSHPLEVNIPYLIRLREELSLPNCLRATASPKSSTGRIGLHVRLLSDKTARYDQIPYGYHGSLWLLVISKSFPIILRHNMSLTQLRFIKGQSLLDTPTKLQLFLNKYHTVIPPRSKSEISDHDSNLILTLSLKSKISAWTPRPAPPLIDLRKKNASLAAQQFFLPLYAQDDRLFLGQGKFYILTTRERIKIPRHYAAEFLPIDPYSGEFRSHYAGFVDPGWGGQSEGGRPLTLEVRPFENIVVHEGQPIVKMQFNSLVAAARRHYDQRQKSHYRHQEGPQLAKYFTDF